MNKRLVITGNIGSGKSTVTKIFEQSGYKVISADELNAKVLENYHIAISKMFSLPPQKFDTFRKTLSNTVFRDKDKMKQLESFMIPRVKLDMEFWCNYYENERRKYVIEIPTYFEMNGLKKHKDYVIMVRTDKDIRVKRILERNPHLSTQDVLDRIDSQIEPEKKSRFCDGEIINDSSYDDLEIATLAQKYIYERDN